MARTAYDRGMGLLLGTTTRVHRLLDRVTRGRFGRTFPGGAQVVWIYTRGRRSGQWRRFPLLAAHESASSWVIAGSNGGQERVPSWVFNIVAYDQGWLDVNDSHWAVQFEEVLGPERDEVYQLMVGVWKAYAAYAQRTPRYIPVFRIHLLSEVPASSLPSL